MRRCLIIFAREPLMGTVKTRLQGRLSKAGCLKLYKAFLKDTLNIAARLECEERFLAYEAANKAPEHLRRIAPFFKFFKQKGKDLGERMHNAFLCVHASNKPAQMVIIGSDAPSLPAEFIAEAFLKLGGADLILGPARDGGYYLIGLKRPCASIFKGIKWSSGKVFEQTVKNAARLKKKTAFLKTWYDVDSACDLDYLTGALNNQDNKGVCQWTRKFLKV